ncbi:MAG: alkaline phosphatase family protein, partial [Bacteroidota bacterium]
SKSKFIFLGWDAADWKVINPLIDQGKMPNLERLIDEGVMGNLATLDPPYSPMLWTSIATGKRPYKHGVLGFQEPCDKGTGVRPVMSTTRNCRAIWNILTLKDYKTHVVGWWPSHPAEPINGSMVSDFFQKPTGAFFESWPLAPRSVYPQDFIKEFANLRVHPDELTGEHILPFIPKADKIDPNNPRLKSVIRETAMAASLHNVFTNILRTKEWDFAALYLATIDHYCHGNMRFHPPKRPHISQADFDLFHNVVTQGYVFHDMMLGRIMDFMDDQTTLMLVSDHGFQPDHLRPRDIPGEPAGPAYEHSPYGIFVMKGPGVKKDEIIYGANLLDVTPTILTSLRLPIGEDMDGKVLTQAFEHEPEVQKIESWEVMPGVDGRHPKTKGEEENIAAMALQQLVDLGYIEKPGIDPEQNRKRAHNECQFNLAKAFIDGGLIRDAVPILEQLFGETPTTSRYAFLLATTYQALGKLKKCRQVIEHMRALEQFDEPTIDVMEAGLLLGEKRPILAIKLFRKAEENIQDPLTRLHLQIAEGYFMLKRYPLAEQSITKELDIDPHNADAYALLGKVLMSDKRFDQALEALLTAVGLEYEMPTVHHHIGICLTHLGEYDKAADALEVALIMAPKYNTARSKLINLYRVHLDQEELANQHEAAFDKSILGTVTIVSGLPRSGTSMMMQMLEKGGLKPFTDKVRSSDENNPKGYYEHEQVKNLKHQKQFVFNAIDKSLKVVAPLLPQLPQRLRYKVIFMERDFSEIYDSQGKMLNRLGKEKQTELEKATLIAQYENNLQSIKQWISRNPHVEAIYINYKNVLDNPFGQAIAINEFLDYQLLPELMVQAVDSDLYRERLDPQ